MYGSVAAVALPLVKFFKHSGPLPNPTRTDNHDNSDNVAPRSRPSSVHTHHQSLVGCRPNLDVLTAWDHGLQVVDRGFEWCRSKVVGASLYGRALE